MSGKDTNVPSKEYISREAVLARKGNCYDSEGHLLYAVGTGDILRIPAADVVEVVRCCECIYHDDESQYHYCRKWGRSCPDDSDFFCKWGKRKYGGQDR